MTTVTKRVPPGASGGATNRVVSAPVVDATKRVASDVTASTTNRVASTPAVDATQRVTGAITLSATPRLSVSILDLDSLLLLEGDSSGALALGDLSGYLQLQGTY